MSARHPYIIVHHPSGDEAEADSLEAAHVAARTLIDDNDHAGQCWIKTFGYQIVGYVYARDGDRFGQSSLGTTR